MSTRLGSATKVSTSPLRHCLHFLFRFRPALQAESLTPYLVRRLLHNPIVNTGCMTLMFLPGLMWIDMGPRGTCTGHVEAAETRAGSTSSFIEAESLVVVVSRGVYIV